MSSSMIRTSSAGRVRRAARDSLGNGRARRIRESGTDDETFRPPARERLLDLRRIDAVATAHAQRQHARLESAEQLEHSVVTRSLDRHEIARLDQQRQHYVQACVHPVTVSNCLPATLAPRLRSRSAEVLPQVVIALWMMIGKYRRAFVHERARKRFDNSFVGSESRPGTPRRD
jgi:hypothetical protein